ncbi:MAG TPA: penicillin-binding protein activator, partial [Rhodospirillales bacterium]|nr:penicillin-binding protein activator [Rhodospirillales bacterium]
MTVSPAPGPPPIVETSAPMEQPVKVALLLPLSGRLANLGKAMADAAQMAMFDLADPRFQLLPIDDKGTTSGAAEAARQAVADGAQLIIGPLLAASVSAVTPIASAAGVPVIAFSSDRKVAAEGVYIIGFTPDAEVQRVIDFAAQGGLSRFGVLAPDNLYGAAVVEATRRAVAQNRATLVRIQLYEPNTQDFAPVVRKLLGLPEPAPAPAAPPAGTAAGTALPGTPLPPAAATVSPPPPVIMPPRTFDALLLAEGGSQLRGLAAALSTAGVRSPSAQLLGTGKWDEPGVGTETALIGAWFAAPSPVNREEFETRYRRAFGQSPPRLATLAYAATALSAVLARGPQQQPFTLTALTDPSGFYGRDGLFRLNSDGLADRKLAILRVDRGGVTVIDEPP